MSVDDPNESSHVDVALLVDRFVSASTADDVLTSLESLLDALEQQQQKNHDHVNVNVNVNMDELYTHDVLQGLVSVLGTCSYKSLTTVDSAAETVVARIYLQLLVVQPSNEKKRDVAAILLQEPSPGRLLETLIDVASASASSEDKNNKDDDDNVQQQSQQSHSVYTRVLCLQLIHQFCVIQPKLAQPQILQAPNGLHRLGDLLATAPHIPEMVRNEALLLAKTMAEWPSAAKIWMFSEVADGVLQTAMAEGGLTKGNVLVLDCLTLLQTMFQHDTNLAELVFQSTTATVAPTLYQLLDLRKGYAFLHPESIAMQQQVKGKEEKDEKDKKDEDDDDDDDEDLDDLIASAKTTKPSPSKASLSATDSTTDSTTPKQPVPHLLPAEETIIHAVFDILATVLENPSVQTLICQQHVPLCTLIWEMGLLLPPLNPDMPYPCAVPSIALQQRALQMTAQYLNSVPIMNRLNGLDRLLYIVCTGGGGSTFQQQMQLQQSALHVIRKTITTQMANEMLLHALAPSPMDNNNDNHNSATTFMVIPKLLNTARDNLQSMPTTTEGGKGEASSGTTNLSGRRHVDPNVVKRQNARKIFISGSFGGLSLFLTDEASRAVLLRLTATNEIYNTTLMDSILECLMTESNEEEVDNDNNFISLHLLRFLMTWIYQAPIVVQTLLSSPHAAALTVLTKNNNNNSNNNLAMTVLLHIILGLCMEYMGDESLCGGFTAQSIMDIIQAKGVSKFLSQLETLKTTTTTTSSSSSMLPWSHCQLEWNIWNTWYTNVVLIVRKRVVQELTGTNTGNGDDSSSEEEEEAGAAAGAAAANQTGPTSSSSIKKKNNKNQKSLQRMLSQQSNEIEELRQELAEAKRLNASQEKQLAAWKKRVESTPTELDEMVSEYIAKNAQLDQQVMALQEEMASLKEQSKQELQARDDQIAQVRQELAETQTREQEACQERDDMQEEMTALSQAYTSLEEEYRRQQAELENAARTTATRSLLSSSSSSLQPGETSVEASSEHASSDGQQAQQQQQQQQQAQGEESQQQQNISMSMSNGSERGSTNVSTLRAENARLQASLKEAENWMAMAQNHMQEMDSRHAQLQQTVDTMTTQMNQMTTASQSSADESTQMLLQEQEHRRNLELQMVEATNGLNQQLKEEHQRFEQLEQTLQTVQADANAERAKLLSQIDALEHELQQASEQLKMQQQQQQVPPTSDSSEGAPAMEETNALKQQIESLQKETESLRANLESNRHEFEQILQQRDEIIRNLQDASAATNSTPTTPNTDDDVAEQLRAKDAVIQELSHANHEAQEWINHAVQRDQVLTADFTRLMEENQQLQQQQLEEQEQVNTLAVRVQELVRELSTAQSQLQQLQAELSVKDQEIQLLQGRAVGDDGMASALQAQITERDNEIAALKTQLEQQQQLQLQQQDASDNQESSKVVVAELKTRIAEMETTMAATIVERDQVLADLQAKTTAFEQLTEQQPLAGPQPATAELHEVIKNLELRIADQEEEHNSVINEWEQTYATLEAEKSKLETDIQTAVQEREKLDNDLKESQSLVDNLTNELNETTAALEEMTLKQELNKEQATTVVEDTSTEKSNHLLEQIMELEAKVLTLEEQLEDEANEAKEVIAMWEASYQELESKLADAAQKEEAAPSITTEEESAEVVEKLETTTPAATETNEGSAEDVEKLKRTVAELEQELEETVVEAETAINDWQNCYNSLQLELEETMNERDRLMEQILSYQNNSQSEDKPEESIETAAPETANNDARIAKLEAAVKDLEEQLSEVTLEAEESVTAWMNNCEQLQSDVQALEVEKENLSKLLGENDQTQDVDKLKENIQSLETRLKEQDVEFQKVIRQWQDSYYGLESQHQDAMLENGRVTSELNSCKTSLHSLYKELDFNSSTSSESETSDLSDELDAKELAARLRSKVLAGMTAASQTIGKLSVEVKQAQDDLAEATAKLNAVLVADAKKTMDAGHVSELEIMTQNLQQQLVNEKARADEMNTNYEQMSAELNRKITDLEKQLERQEGEHESSIEKWQEYYSDLEDRFDEVTVEKESIRSQLQTAKLELEKLQSDDSDATTIQDQRNRIAELEDSLKNYEEQISDLTEDAEEAIQMWQNQCDALQSELETTRQEKDSLAREASSAQALKEKSTSEGQERDELLKQINDLEEQLDTTTVQAEQAVAEWSKSYEMLMMDYETLKVENSDLNQELEEYKSLVASGDESIEEVKFECTDEGVTETSTRSDSTRVRHLEEKVDTQLAKIQQLQSDLEKARHDRNELQAACDRLNREKNAMEDAISAINVEKTARRNAESRCASLEKKIAEVEKSLNARVLSVVSEKDRIIDKLTNDKLLTQHRVEDLEIQVNELRDSKAALEHENEKSQRQLAELEEEIKETNKAMHLYITKESTGRATDVATDVLNEEIEQLEKDLAQYKEMLSVEREQRQRFENESLKLSADLAILLGIENLDNNRADIQQLTMNATEKIQKKERAEIEALKNSLSRALEELATARNSERQLEERVAKATHQVIVYEQEVLAAKNEFHFLTQAMDEMRESDLTARASLEYRIATLENDIKVQRLSFTSEVEGLRSELSQVSMERDRFFQSLKENNRSRENIAASSSDALSIAKLDLRAEVRKLQMEKASLLAAASDDASRLERRLREARAAEKAAAEADIMLERELRFAAEKSAETYKLELADLKDELASKSSFRSQEEKSKDLEKIESLQNDLKQAQDQVEVHLKENRALRDRLETSMKEAQLSIERLQLQAKQATARANHLERAEHFEAEVRAEQARLQAPSSIIIHHGMDSNEEEKKHDEGQITKLYAVIKSQNERLEDGYGVYMELVHENERLLATFAQQDLLRKELNSVVVELGGQDVLNSTIHEFEEKAKAAFGYAVKFEN